MSKRKVIIEVLGGVAECTSCPDDVEVEIIDHDNEGSCEHSRIRNGICQECWERV